FKCIVSHDGVFNTELAYGTTEELWFPQWEFKGAPWKNRELYRKWSPHLFADKFKTPTLVIHGQNDYRIDVSQGFDLFTTLQRLKVPSKMLYFPDEGHWCSNRRTRSYGTRRSTIGLTSGAENKQSPQRIEFGRMTTRRLQPVFIIG